MNYYCETCSKDITNQWAIIGNRHVGCPKASNPNTTEQEFIQAKEDKMRETADEVMGEMLSTEERGE